MSRAGSKILQTLAPLVREYAAGARAKEAGRKVAVLGAAGGIGQPLSLLMKVMSVGSRAASKHRDLDRAMGPPGSGERAPLHAYGVYHDLLL